jgi:hypothetical protein
VAKTMTFQDSIFSFRMLARKRKLGQLCFIVLFLCLGAANAMGGSEENSHHENQIINGLEVYFSRLKDEIIIGKKGIFPKWEQEIRYYVDPQKVDKETQNIVKKSFIEISSITYLSIFRVYDLEEANFIIVKSEKNSDDIKKVVNGMHFLSGNS